MDKNNPYPDVNQGMDIAGIIKRLKNNEISPEEAEHQLKIVAFEQLSDIAKVDIHRAKRVGIPEAILADCKTDEDIVSIARVHLEHEGRAIITRACGNNYTSLTKLASDEGVGIRWNEKARIVVIGEAVPSTGGKVGVISAGTADIPVAEEAKVIAEEMGCSVTTIYDAGVAGIHRLFPELAKLVENGVDAIVVAAGREGTLPAIVSGLVDVPVIGIPVSTGYGAGGKGEAALLSMLQSCSVLTVVNIDAGFVAGAFAARIANIAAKHRNQKG